MARPRTPLLSRERIVAAALALVDADGLEALSTRRLATELSVSGPSLYNHFATKDELLDAVVDSVMGEVDLGMFAAGADWRTALRDWAYPTGPHSPPTRTWSRCSPRGRGGGRTRCGWPTRSSAAWSRRAGRAARPPGSAR